jgi:hypothetical protein
MHKHSRRDTERHLALFVQSRHLSGNSGHSRHSTVQAGGPEIRRDGDSKLEEQLCDSFDCWYIAGTDRATSLASAAGADTNPFR